MFSNAPIPLYAVLSALLGLGAFLVVACGDDESALPLSPSAQRTILDEIKAHPGVLDAAIVQDGRRLSLVLLVDYATNEEYAKQVGEDFVRLAMTYGAGIRPGYPDLGPGKYDYLIGVYYPNETPVAEGAKVDFARRITW